MKKFVKFLTAVIVASCVSAPVMAHNAWTSRTAMLHLWGWNWNSIKNHCAEIGDAGWAAIETMPAQNHRRDGAKVQGYNTANDLYPWWLSYQPVGYSTNSRYGTSTELSQMISTCASHGVDVYVDTVWNHSTGSVVGGGSDLAYDGTSFSYRSVPGLYSGSDYHQHFNTEHPWCASDNTINNWSSVDNVQQCELSGLADLKTWQSNVMTNTINHIAALKALGVKGFRVDAAKHMNRQDLINIYNGTNMSGVYVYHETIGDATIPESQYYDLGSTGSDGIDFEIGTEWHRVWTQYGVDDLETWGATWGGLSPSDKAVGFTDNHDTTRSNPGGVFNVEDGAIYYLANGFLLARPYAYIQVLDGYVFSNNDQGPPVVAGANGKAADVNCNNPSVWRCNFRNKYIKGGMQYRNYTSGVAETNWWDNNGNVVHVSRGTTGWYALNAQSSGDYQAWMNTNVAAGEYCDLNEGGYNSTTQQCNGRRVYVKSNGWTHSKVKAMDAIAIVTQQKMPTVTTNPNVHFYCLNGNTVTGQDVYVTGNHASIGNWNTASGIKLRADAYNTWNGVIKNLPANYALQWKCYKKQGSTVVWEGGSNNTVNTGANGGWVDTEGAF